MAGVAIDVWNLRGSLLVRCSHSAAWTRKPELGAGAPEQGPLLLFKEHLARKSGLASATPWLSTNYRQARRLLPCGAVSSCSSGLHDAPHSSLHDEVATFRERARELGHGGLDPAEGLWLGWRDQNLACLMARQDSPALLGEVPDLAAEVLVLKQTAEREAARALAGAVAADFDFQAEVARLRAEALQGMAGRAHEAGGNEGSSLECVGAAPPHDRQALSFWQQQVEGVPDIMEQLLARGGPAQPSFPSLAGWMSGVALLAGQSYSGVAWAEEAVTANVAAALEGPVAAQAGTLPGWLQPAILATPLLLYGGFYWYRDNVNQRLSPFDYVTLLLVVLAVTNLVLAVFFKVRLF